jgi:hypothetical protein
LIIRAVRFGQNVLDPSGFANGSDRSSGNDSRTGICWHKDHFRSTTATANDVRNRVINDGDFDLFARGLLCSLLDTGRHFIRLAITPADFTAAVADHDHRCKAKSSTTLHDRRATTNLDGPLDVLCVV